MFDGATKETIMCPVVPINKGPKYQVRIRTRYATIEQTFSNKDLALDFLEVTRKNMDIVSYEIKTKDG